MPAIVADDSFLCHLFVEYGLTTSQTQRGWLYYIEQAAIVSPQNAPLPAPIRPTFRPSMNIL